MLAADVQRSAPALVVGGDRDELEDPLDVHVVEARLEQPLRRLSAHEPLRAGARVDPGRLDADDPAHARLGRGGDPDQRDHLLRREAGHRRAPRERIARRDAHFRAPRGLARDDVARHVLALLLRIEIDRAVDLRGDQLLRAAPAEPDRLLHALHARAGQAEANLGARRLQVVEEMSRLGHADRLVSPGSVAAADSSFPRLVSLAAHDLRTPLATIHGFAQTLLRMGDLQEPNDRYMTMRSE